MISNRPSLPSLQLTLGRRLVAHNTSWYHAHELLAPQEDSMPTLREYFASFQEFVHDSTGNPYSADRMRVYRSRRLTHTTEKLLWLDALFFRKDGQWYLRQKHEFQSQELIPQEEILLEEFLQTEGKVAAPHFSSLGLPLKSVLKGRNTLYYRPPQTDRFVVSLRVGPKGAILNCNTNPHEHHLTAVLPIYRSAPPVVSLEERTKTA